MTSPRPDPFSPAVDPAPSNTDQAATIHLQDEPGHLIRRAHQLAVSVFHQSHGRQITPVQYVILRALQDSPGIDQVTLADRIALDTSTTADIAARLDSKGWIRRDMLARRQRSLSLTAEGEAVIASMLPHVAPMNRRLLETLDAHEQAEFMRLLRKFVQLDTPATGATD